MEIFHASENPLFYYKYAFTAFLLDQFFISSQKKHLGIRLIDWA